MHFASPKKIFLRARTHKAHFLTHKYGVWISKNSKFEQNSLLEEFVPVVCTTTKKNCETTNHWYCVEVSLLPFGVTCHHTDYMTPVNTKISPGFLKKTTVQSTLKNSMFFRKKSKNFDFVQRFKYVCDTFLMLVNFWENYLRTQNQLRNNFSMRKFSQKYLYLDYVDVSVFANIDKMKT